MVWHCHLIQKAGSSGLLYPTLAAAAWGDAPACARDLCVAWHVLGLLLRWCIMPFMRHARPPATAAPTTAPCPPPAQVPPTMRFIMDGEMPEYLLAKDLILQIIGEISVQGATYKAMEFAGSAIEGMNMEERMTICNMVVEAGGEAGVATCVAGPVRVGSVAACACMASADDACVPQYLCVSRVHSRPACLLHAAWHQLPTSGAEVCMPLG